VASTLAVPESGGLLAYIIPEEELVVRAYHRTCSSGTLTPAEWLSSLAGTATVSPLDDAPLAFGSIGVHHATGSWRIDLPGSDPARIDAGWLDDAVLGPVFGIHDTRNDARMAYIPGTEDRAALRRRAALHPDRTYFELHPVPTAQIKAVADAGGTFPPKSTWIEPKLRSALFVHLHGPQDAR
jgi:uncharacterized protein (DUF1015 family)